MNERSVSMGGVPEDKVLDTLTKQLGDEWSEKTVSDAVVKFETVSLYSFKVEFAVKGDDLIFHFMLPEHANTDTPTKSQAWLDYWLHRFAEKLNVIAQDHFKVGYPRLVAKYTEEVGSWWLKAQGFGASSDPQLLSTRFFEKLDAALKEKSQTPDASS